MTIPGWGRVTPLQIDMLHLAGHVLDDSDATEEEKRVAIARGKRELERRTGQEFGYDLKRWHNYLVKTNKEEYCHSYAWNSVQPAIENAFDDPVRARLVTLLEQTPKKLSSEGLACAIVERLIRVGILQQNQLQPVVPFVRDEIEDRKSIGEY